MPKGSGSAPGLYTHTKIGSTVNTSHRREPVYQAAHGSDSTPMTRPDLRKREDDAIQEQVETISEKRTLIAKTSEKSRQASPEDLGDSEDQPEDDFYNDQDSAGNGGNGGKKKKKGGFLAGKLGRAAKMRIIAMIIGLITGATGLTITSITSGAMSFVHIAKMLSSLRLDKHDNQQNHRMMRVMQYYKQHKERTKNLPLQQLDRTRISKIGNIFAKRFEIRMQNAGFTARLGPDGRFAGWTIDAKKVIPDRDLSRMSEADIRANLAGRLGTTMDRAGPNGTFEIDFKANKLGYYSGNKLVARMAAQAGYGKILGGLHARLVGKLTGVGWHPIQKVKDKYRGKITEPIKKRAQERMRKLVRGIGFKPSNVITRGGQDRSGQDIATMADGAYNSDPTDKKTFQKLSDDITSKLAPIADTINLRDILFATAAINAFCFIYNILILWNKIKWALLAVPMMNMAMEAIATGNQVMDGNNPEGDGDIDMGNLAYKANLNYDRTTGTSWSDATSLAAARGINGGESRDLPKYLKPGPSESSVVTFANSNLVGSTLGSACALVGNLAFEVVFNIGAGIVTIFTGGAAKVGTELVKQAAKLVVKNLVKFGLKLYISNEIKDSDTFKALAEKLGEFLANQLVDPEAKGALRGSFYDYGAFMFGNGKAISNGGLPLSKKNAMEINQAEQKLQDDEFQEKSFASRMFDTQDYRSAISKFMDSQPPSPGDQFAHLSHSFFGIGKSVASMPGRLLGSVTHAAPFTGYDHGFDDYGYTANDMDNRDTEDPFVNAQAVHTIMEDKTPIAATVGTMNVQQTYAQRANYCFGKIISLPNGPDDPLTVKDDVAIGPPDYDTINNYPASVKIGGTAGFALNSFLTAGLPIPGLPGADVARAAYYTASGSDGVGEGNCRDNSLEWKRIRMFIFDTNTINTMACFESRPENAESKDKALAEETKEGNQACQDTGYGGSSGGGGDCKEGVPKGDLPGWQQIFTDDFTIDAPKGSWATSDASKVVYTGDSGGQWVTYPDGWPSTYSGGAPAYSPSTVLSVHDSYLDFEFQNNQGANPSPIINGTSQYQTYGRYSICMKADANLGGYYGVPLLWPQDEGAWSCAESDFPEGHLDGEAGGFAHNCANGQDAISTNGAKFTDWHVYTQEWMPGVRKYYVDGKLVGESRNAVYAGPERWQLQMEVNGGGPGGHLLVDWVAVYAHAGAQ